MSRALTVYSRKDKEAAHPSDKIEAIMQSQGCSEPVARNLLKYGKLGIGPLAGGGESSSARIEDGDWLRESYRRDQEKAASERRRPPPPKIEIKAVMTHAEKKQRLRDQEERLRMELEQREREQEEQSRKDTKKKVAGLERLGPVMARNSEIDPLQPLISVQEMLAQKQVEQQEGKDEGDEEEKDKDKDQDGEPTQEDRDEDGMMRRFEEKKRTPQDEAAKKRDQGRKKKRRRKGNEGESSSEEYQAAQGRGESDSDQDARGKAARSSSAGSSLMTEAEVKAMMNKEKPKGARGSVRTKSRIQKEMAEWESAKADNAEFWKAPKFCLCYSAETTRALRH